MSVLILAGAYTYDPQMFAALRDSCAKWSAPLQIVGERRFYPGMQAIQVAADFLRTRSEEYVICTDAYDTIMSRWDEVELVRMIDSTPDLIMSVEQWVWPEGPWAARYTALIGRYFWYAINGGQYCGRRAQMISMLDEMWARWQRGEASAQGSSQELLHKMYAAGAPFTLDLECRIFQSMYGPHAAKIVPRDGRAYNTATGSEPMILHFNGSAPGLGEWREALEVADTRGGLNP